jgi:hypothetical protein
MSIKRLFDAVEPRAVCAGGLSRGAVEGVDDSTSARSDRIAGLIIDGGLF